MSDKGEVRPIDANALLDAMPKSDVLLRHQVVDAICNSPPIDVAPVVHGHFVHDGPRFSGGVDWWHCSSCGRLASGVETRFCYCPFCGAKMDGGDDGETD